jgi:amino acid adenylation domain-containing protein
VREHIQSDKAGPPTGYRIPASPLQEQWWFVDRWQTGVASTIVVLALRIGGRCDIPAVEQAVKVLASRHDALRATLEADDDRLHYLVGDGSAQLLTVTRHAIAPVAERDEAVARIVSAAAGHRFDLTAGPLFAATLDVFAPTDQLLCLIGHRAVVDMSSLSVLAEEFGALYVSFTQNWRADLPPPAGQYPGLPRTAIVAGTGDSTDAIGYWEGKLVDPPAAELPADFPRPATMSFRGDRVKTVLSGAALAEVRALANRANVGLRAALLAATAVVAGRHTGSNRLAIGIGHNGRRTAESSRVVGPLSDALPVCVDLSGDPSAVELLSSTQAEINEVMAHADLSFVEVVKHLNRPRDASRHPIFQIGVDVVPDLGEQLRSAFHGADLAVVDAVDVDQRLDMRVKGIESSDALLLTIEYASDLFDRRRVEHLAEHLVRVLAEMAKTPTRHIDELRMLSERELACLSLTWQGADRPYNNEMVHELFARQVARTPDAIAVEQPHLALTYAELDLWSTRLANLLRRKGAGPDTLVGVCLERGVDALVAILGTLKAGGAYVPLDPTYPGERLRYILADSEASVLITSERLSPIFGEPTGVPIVLVDRDKQDIANESSALPASGVGKENLVYVMYTSGSTGRPKGVRTRHFNLSWYLSWFLGTIPADRFAKVFGTIAFSFDVCAMDIWPPILTGGKVLLSEGLLAIPDTSPEFAGTTLMNLVPSVLEEFLRRNRLPPTVRTITVGGEHMSDKLLGEIFERSNVDDVFYLYGPTETTVFVTAKHFVRGRPQPVTIGRPMHRTRVDILDAKGRITPIGVPGEACVSGPGVAGGYLGRPELTAERFVANHHARHRHGEHDERDDSDVDVIMYRTGDLCRWNFEGEIEFLGRLDEQVKVRGVRIELGEIEATVERHPSVSHAVVAVKEHVFGHQELVAYVVLADEGFPVGDLQPFCQDRLPTVMVPTAFIAIDAVPMSPAGKVNRKALPDPAAVIDARRRPAAAPATQVEMMLAEIWVNILDKPEIKSDDNFFRIGGHSLSAIRLVTEIERRVGVKVPVRTLFKTPVLSALALVIERASAPV